MNDNSFKSSLNSNNTQVEKFIHFFPHLKCSIGKLIKYGTNKTMHFIYFFVDILNPLMKPLVHGKENDIYVE